MRGVLFSAAAMPRPGSGINHGVWPDAAAGSIVTASAATRGAPWTEETDIMSRTVARLLAESLEAHDIDQIFCVPGESYIGLTNALSDLNSLRVVVCRHEGGAGFMAVADGRLRNRAGVCMV